MTTVRWVIDDYLEDRGLPSGMPTLSTAVTEGGQILHRMSFDRKDMSSLRGDFPVDGKDPVVCVGAIPLIDELVHSRPDWIPGAFPHGPSFACSTWSVHLRDLMLNEEFEILGWETFLARRALGPRDVFVRPDDGHKTFPGTLLKRGFDVHAAEEGSRFAYPFHKMRETDRILVSEPKEILGESRFLVVDGRVVTGSTYRWDGKLDVRQDVPTESRDLAAEVARRPWQAAAAYVCDVAVVEDRGGWKARLVELNPFSSAGLYAGDTRIVVREVSRLAERLWREGRL